MAVAGPEDLKKTYWKERDPPGQDRDGCGKHGVHEQRKHPACGRLAGAYTNRASMRAERFGSATCHPLELAESGQAAHGGTRRDGTDDGGHPGQGSQTSYCRRTCARKPRPRSASHASGSSCAGRPDPQRRDGDVRSVYLPRGLSYLDMIEEAPAADKAPHVGVRILPGVCRHEKGSVRVFQDIKAQS